METKPLEDPMLQEIAKVLGDCCTGSYITKVLERQNIPDVLGSNETKWRRLYEALASAQNECQCSGRTFDTIKAILDPVRFTDDTAYFEETRQKLNEKLAFYGVEYGPDGEFKDRPVARTLADAKRHGTIFDKLRHRNIHPEVLAYCERELRQDNYFHAVLEASKGLAQHIRDKSGSGKDGVALVDEVFSTKDPILAFNALKTETDRSEHVGFATQLKGCFISIRNPRAHEPRVHRDDDDSAVDDLALISQMYRKIDGCRRTAPRSRAKESNGSWPNPFSNPFRKLGEL